MILYVVKVVALATPESDQFPAYFIVTGIFL